MSAFLVRAIARSPETACPVDSTESEKPLTTDSRVRSCTARWRGLALAVGLVAIGTSLSGCTRTQISRAIEVPVSTEVIELKGRYQREYVLGQFDEIEVLVRNDEDASRKVLIGADGTVSLPLVGRVEAAGLTVRALANRLTDRFAERMRNPEITVIPVKVREAQVYVLGQVGSPGAVPFSQATTALEAMAHAGDMSSTAAKRSVALIRLGDDGKLRVLVIEPAHGAQPGAYLALGALALEPEDILFVPERPIAQLSRTLGEFVAPFTAVAAVLQPYLTLTLINDLDTP